MNQYIITAYDYTDEGALDRRMKVRPRHFDGARRLKDDAHFILGGAILDDAGKMIGSVMIMQFENNGQLAHWQQTEPYITEKIWERYEIKPFKVAAV